jgi:hypothetical protein
MPYMGGANGVGSNNHHNHRNHHSGWSHKKVYVAKAINFLKAGGPGAPPTASMRMIL